MQIHKLITYTFFVLLLLFKSTASYAFEPQSAVSSHQPSIDLLKVSQDYYQLVSNPEEFNIKSCPVILNKLYSDLIEVDPHAFNFDKVNGDYLEIINTIWLGRLMLRERLGDFVKTHQHDLKNKELLGCVQSMRTAIRATRYIEDYLGELFIAPEVYVADLHPKTLNTLEGVSPELLLPPGNDQVKVRSGDVFMSRGNAITSAAIARIGDVDTQFSHISLIYIIGEKPGAEFTIEEIRTMDNVLALEAHIEIGSTIRPMREYLDDGNARVLQFRYPDHELAHKAAQYSYKVLTKKMKKSQKWWKPWLKKDDVNHNVPYDFKMSLKDTDEVFCSEMAYMGFIKYGVKMPTFMSQIPLTNDLAHRLGIKQFKTFAPGDMDVDSQFELLAEWRDYRKIRNIRYKDAILTKVFEWMENDGYKFKPNVIKNLKSRFGKLVRAADLGFKHKFPKNIPVKAMDSIVILEEIGTLMQDHLEQLGSQYREQNGGLLFYHQAMLEALESYKNKDLEKYKKGKKTKFHNIFSPPRASNTPRRYPVGPGSRH